MHSMKWSLKSLFVATFFAAATFAAAFVLGNSITLAFGPGTSGFVSAIITTILVVVCARIVDRPGVFTLMVTLFTILAIPTNLFGPPGPHKIAIGFLTGLAYDLVWVSASKLGAKRMALPLAAAVATAVSIVLVLQLMVFLDHPKVEALKKAMVFVAPIYSLLGFVGGVLGNQVYDRLKDLDLVKQLKGLGDAGS